MIATWIVLVVGSIGFLFAMIPIIEAQIVTFILLASYRPMMYSVVSVYISLFVFFFLIFFSPFYFIILFINKINKKMKINFKIIKID